MTAKEILRQSGAVDREACVSTFESMMAQIKTVFSEPFYLEILDHENPSKINFGRPLAYIYLTDAQRGYLKIDIYAKGTDYIIGWSFACGQLFNQYYDTPNLETAFKSFIRWSSNRFKFIV